MSDLRRVLSKVLFLSILSTNVFAQSGTLIVHVKSITEPQGTLRYLLFNKEEGFPGNIKSAVIKGSIKISSIGDLAVTLNNLTYGEYAFSAYQDLNDNGHLDKNFFGIPREPLCTSNDPKGHMGPPKYKDAKFLLNQDVLEITVNMVHP